MRTALEKGKNIRFAVWMAVLLFLQLGVCFYFGNKKAGFHEDELYTFYSTNKTAGLSVNDRQWLTREQIRNDFVVLPGEGFRYGVVKQMQSWDVHPPFYYYLFHTACSLFPGVFSKWLGIGVNMIGFAGSFFLLAYVADMGKRGKMLSFLTCLAWGFGSAVISGVMFIRMYQWLTFFVLLCLSLHIRAVKKNDFRAVTFFLPLAATVFFGFLTQYYYIIFHFFLGAGFVFMLLRKKRIKELISYGAACGLGFAAAVAYYPASLSHIFRGYRGTEAVSEFSNVSNTLGRLRFFYGLFDDFMLNGTLSWWLLALCLLAVTAFYLGKKGNGKGAAFDGIAGLILFACAGYFFTISKTALLLGESSSRYQLPIYGLMLFLVLYSVWTLCGALPFFSDSCADKERNYRMLAGVLGAVLVLTNAFAIRNGRVFFLYEEEKQVREYIQAHKDDTVVVFYNDTLSGFTWWLSDELMEFDKVYLASQGNPDLISDEVILESEKLLVYVADYENKEECLERLMEANKHLKSCQIAAQKNFWTLYELGS